MNKRIRKKTMKRLERLKQLKPIVATPIIKEYKAHLLYHGKYATENKDYQSQLDKHYNGTIQPIERCINLNASILHYCSECDTEFYNAGKYLLNPNKKHECHAVVGASTINHKIKKNGVNSDELAKRFHRMVWADYSFTSIAKELQINPKIVKDYFKEEGLI